VTHIDVDYHIDMKNTTSVVINFTIDPRLLQRIDDYWHQYRLPNRAKTFKHLVTLALDQQRKARPKSRKEK
jgi:hypothetical protein